MQRAIQITFKDIPHSDAVEQHIREKAAKLETFYPNIIGCHVTVETPHKHQHQGKQHNVRLDVKVPGGEIVVNRDSHEDVYVALRDAFDAAKRQIEEYGRRQRGDVKQHNNRVAPPVE
ncbi:MAG: ribosome-associated translation inhibitor RaiA [Rhodocyclales bacterium]|nr:ribosome-associated translation inhibitor RaiA [Rhodocyclales bacterium]